MPIDRKKPSQILAALNHAAHTFRSFTAADWRAMAEECLHQANDRTCADCGCDVHMSASSGAAARPRREHRWIDDRWSCREPFDEGAARTCPCGDGDGEGCPIHGFGSP